MELGSRDPIAEARSGLALGLGGTYFDGLEALVIDWFINEPDSEVSQHLLDHMIRQSEDCASYSALVLEIYEKEPTGSSLRKRMETTAAGTILYSRLRQIDRSDDLFGGVTNVTNNTFNIKGGFKVARYRSAGKPQTSVQRRYTTIRKPWRQFNRSFQN